MTFGYYNSLIKLKGMILILNILQVTDLKKYYGAEPNITKMLDGDTVDNEITQLADRIVRIEDGRIVG